MLPFSFKMEFDHTDNIGEYEELIFELQQSTNLKNKLLKVFSRN
jgi:hypothetical protein